jgi:membrane fusion protein (multidrug efflux system)
MQALGAHQMDFSLENKDVDQFAISQNGRDLRDESKAPRETDVPFSLDERHPGSEPGIKLEALASDLPIGQRLNFDSSDGLGRDDTIARPALWYERIDKRVLLFSLLLLVVAAVAPFGWSYLQSYESTDDAQIDGHIDPLSSRIDGTVVRVYPEDDDRVTKGELLVEIDPRDYNVALEQARARLALARAQLASAKQDYAAALANVREAEATNFKAQRDARRFAILLDKRVVPQEQYDEYTAVARVDAAKVDSAGQAAGSALAAIAARQADTDAAKAVVDQALLNLSYTKIYAPANGIVGKRSVQLGSRIQPGQTLMFVTETDDIWVTADFKETQLARMHRGEKVTIHVDTFGRNYRGRVEHMPGASGDRFSLLPAENATGNYVKVVQRLPVRIVLESGQDPDHHLHPGMSVEPTVWLR